MSKISKFLGIFFPLVLVLIAVFLCVRNYTPGTYLIGWDSLHPEFNFRLAFQRAFSGVWRENQGLGALAAHSHMADLPHIFVLWLSSFVLPQNLLRYSYFFLCLVLGSLGVYFFVNYILSKGKKPVSHLPAFVSALSYLLNLITLQHFFVPFEMFAVQFAFLPFILLFMVKFLDNGRKKDLLFLSLALIFASPMAYAATLFWAFMGAVLIFLFVYWLISKNKWQILRRVFVLVFLVLALNLYWILPNIYSIRNQSGIVSSSKINMLFSPEAFIRNEEYGNWKDVALGKNFLFEWRNFDFKENNYVDLVDVWNTHLAEKWMDVVGFGIFTVSFFGIFAALIKKQRIGISLFPVFAYSLFFLMNINPPFGVFYKALYDNFPVFREALRMPFTKFSILFQFVISFYLGYSIFFLSGLIKKFKIGMILSFIVSIVVLSGLIYYNFPVFKGNLISGAVKTKLPREYFELFNWSNGLDGRIARLPVHTHWGWEYHDWKYEGSGFLTYGLENSVLDRDFDRWSPYNETFYNEISNILYQYQLMDKDKLCGDEKCDWDKMEEAVLSSNEKAISEFENILRKYQVSYLLLDESVINAGGSNDILFTPQIKDLIAHSEIINQAAKFGFLTVYKVTMSVPVRKWVWAPESYVDVAVNNTYSQFDSIYSRFGNYITSNSSETGYPFVNFDPRGDVDISVIQVASSSGEMVDNLLVENKKMNAKVVLPIKEKVVEDFDADQGFKEGNNCDLKKKGTVVKRRLEKGNYYKAEDGGVSCDYFYYPQVKNHQGYVLRIKGKNLIGRGLKIYLQNLNTKRMDLETLLPNGEFDKYLVLLPDFVNDDVLDSLDKGYTLSVETRSFGRISSENVVEGIEFIPFDTDFFYSLRKGEGPGGFSNNLKIRNVKKYGTGYYLVDAEVYSLTQNSGGNRSIGLISLGQGYEDGWQAFQVENMNLDIKNLLPWFFGKKLEHVKVNGWANGWKVEEGNGNIPVVIVFWPQYLEFAGFGILFLIFPVLLIPFLKRKKKKKNHRLP